VFSKLAEYVLAVWVADKRLMRKGFKKLDGIFHDRMPASFFIYWFLLKIITKCVDTFKLMTNNGLIDIICYYFPDSIRKMSIIESWILEKVLLPKELF